MFAHILDFQHLDAARAGLPFFAPLLGQHASPKLVACMARLNCFLLPSFSDLGTTLQLSCWQSVFSPGLQRASYLVGNVKASSESPTGQTPQGVADQVVVLLPRLPTSAMAQLDCSDILRLNQACA